MRFPCSATSSNVGLGAYFLAGRCAGHGAAIHTLTLPSSSPFWFKCFSLFHLLRMTTFIVGSHLFTIPTCSHLPEFRLSGRDFLTKISPRSLNDLLLLCQACSLFKALASPGDTGGFLLEKQLDIATSCRTCILRPWKFLRD